MDWTYSDIQDTKKKNKDRITMGSLIVNTHLKYGNEE